jgi:hypothetical protein
MRDLLKNQQLNGLLGGSQQVVLGDAMARLENDSKKLKVRLALAIYYGDEGEGELGEEV